MVDTRFPVFNEIGSFLREGFIVAVKRRVEVPVREAGIVRVLVERFVFVIANRFIVYAADSVHHQVMQLFIILHQIDEHQGTFHILRSGMDRCTVLCRDRYRFLLARVDVSQCYFIRRVFLAHQRHQCTKGTVVVRNRCGFACFEVSLMVVFAVQYVFRPGIVIRKILVINQQILEFLCFIDIEYFACRIV
ncbi:hypothetical protein D3C72_1662790 [compost metagenome]